MKTEELKKSFDAISPTKEQKKKILAGVLTASSTPVSAAKFKFSNAVGSIAAVVVLAAGLFILGQGVMKDNADKVAYINEKEENVTQSEIVEQESIHSESDTSETAEDIGTEAPSRSEAIEPENNIFDAQSTADFENAKKEEPTDMVKKSRETDSGAAVTESSRKTAVSGGGSSTSSAGGGGGSSPAVRSVSLEYIRSDSVYSKLFPAYFPQGFEFGFAVRTEDNLRVVLNNQEGKCITVTITTEAQSGIISPERIKELKGNPMNFVLGCGEYFVVYSAETDNAEELYKMATSSAYFN